MFNHADIWNAIDRLAEEKGLSTSGLAKMAGLDPTTFNKSKRVTADGKLRWPSTESISKILFVTQTPLSVFFQYLSGDAMLDHLTTIPVIDEKSAQSFHLYDSLGNIILHKQHSISFPANKEQKLVAFEITSTLFEPHYNSGDILIIDLTSSLRKGDIVLIKTKKNGFILGLLKKEMTQHVVLETIGMKDSEASLDKGDSEWMGRIIWRSQ